MSLDNDNKLELDSDSDDSDDLNPFEEMMEDMGFIPIASISLENHATARDYPKLEEIIGDYILRVSSMSSVDNMCIVDSVLFRALLSLWEKGREGDHREMALDVMDSLIYLMGFHGKGLDGFAAQSLRASIDAARMLGIGHNIDTEDSSKN